MAHSETSLAQTIIATMRKLGPAPEVNRPEILVNVKDLEAVIEEHLDEYLARDRDETPPPSSHVPGLLEAASEVIACASDTYKKRNSHIGSFEDASGEKSWIVPFDAFEGLRSAVAAIATTEEPENALL